MSRLGVESEKSKIMLLDDNILNDPLCSDWIYKEVMGTVKSCSDCYREIYTQIINGGDMPWEKK